ncbi:hypothetical protein ATKI12_6103 [Kitasatospora sp. Ki12]
MNAANAGRSGRHGLRPGGRHRRSGSWCPVPREAVREKG